MKYAILGLVALLTLGACGERFNELAAKYDPDGTLRCLFLDEARNQAEKVGADLDDWLKTENLVVCAVPAE